MRPKWPPTTSQFLSTLPARGATFDIFANAGNIEFLSTLPVRGATNAYRERCTGGF